MSGVMAALGVLMLLAGLVALLLNTVPAALALWGVAVALIAIAELLNRREHAALGEDSERGDSGDLAA